MNLVTSSAITMSSREISELIGSSHEEVKRSIARLSTTPGDDYRALISLPRLGKYLDSFGRPAKECLVCKRDSFMVVAQLSPNFTGRLFDRWKELEADAENTPLPNFEDPVAAARAWADATEKNQVAQDQLAILELMAECIARFWNNKGEAQ